MSNLTRLWGDKTAQLWNLDIEQVIKKAPRLAVIKPNSACDSLDLLELLL